MAYLLLRLGVLAAITLLAGLSVWAGRRYVAARRHHALAASGPLSPDLIPNLTPNLSPNLSPNPKLEGAGRVRILAFSSEDCRQCHTMQAPALVRVREARPDAVAIAEVDALTHPDLTARYGVLTLPTTVVLDASGRARAVNYGFASTQKLLEQVDEALDVAPVA